LIFITFTYPPIIIIIDDVYLYFLSSPATPYVEQRRK